ncbi:IS66 family insertion sequence element accessory protein TnpB [Granulosicoccus sp.]|nr:IS66 family insertion sequence element accessory protein TnpB [Granulosicoccus sp.]MDB4224164.1 IS66 family insertion sequence element accessory protein TnpB [Granulosicoccus sp.]
MLFPEGNIRVWLYTEPTDMRKTYNGLSALVKNKLHDNPLSGHLYVFINRRRTQMKILFFDRNGYAIWSKRLEQGQFVFHSSGEQKQSLTFAQLQCLLEGIELNNTRQYKRFSLSTP